MASRPPPTSASGERTGDTSLLDPEEDLGGQVSDIDLPSDDDTSYFGNRVLASHGDNPVQMQK